ncbi:MAG TPA: DUF4386 domain-containing protein [Thermoanaerobaculia bacterium]|nr:DUF4386 domain-containing protein [Thermoanaerobaculia bacterium]
MNRDINPQVYARVGGILYLIMIALGIIEEAFIRGRITVGGDAVATFANLQTMEMLWRAGIAIELLMGIITIVLSVILYVLTRPVQRELALLALLFGSIATAVESAYSMQLVEALFPLGRNAYLTAFTPGQLQAMTALAMKAHVFGFGVALLLFGPFFLVTGYLMFKSGYFPKPLGVLYQLAGLAYMFNGFALVLAPQFAGRVFMIIAAPAFLGETSFAVWLLIKGVRIERWRALTSVPAA